MVMDATQPQQPSPQSVGREFVRQYYTLLNKAPNHLHRFYNNNSSFIHGESTLVVGQKNIHNRIQQLNFHDCHAKISQVDAQATLGNGVVVQVTGELSNDGQPMRRFTQTFVLAAQSPKKYYVHNDIFRYQDLYPDEEIDGETRSENGEDHEQLTSVGGSLSATSHDIQSPVGIGNVEQQQQLPSQLIGSGGGGVITQDQQAAQSLGQHQQPTIYYSMPATGSRPVQVLATPQGGGGGAIPVGTPFTTGTGGGGGAALSSQQLNGIISHDELLTGSNPQQTIISQSGGAAVVQGPGVLPLTSTAILAQQQSSGGGIAASVVNTPALSGFQQSPLIQQQQHLQQQQQPQSNLTSTTTQQQQQQQQPSLQSSPNITLNVDSDDTISITTAPSSAISKNTVTHTNNINADGDVSSSLRSNIITAPIVDDFKTINEQQQQEKYEIEKQQQQLQNEPKTYANLFKSNSASPSGFLSASIQSQQPLQNQSSIAYQSSNTNTISPTTFTPSNTTTSSSVNMYNSRNNNNDGSSSSSLRLDNNNIGSGSQGGQPLLPRTSSTRINKDFDQRRSSNVQQFGDNQQLFLGNIPHHATEDELKTVFARFGNVLELRILSKAGGKLPPGVRNPLNYGFITYDDPESVQNCLANCPLYFPENSSDGQKLNVEEKKPRMRTNELPRQSMGNSNSVSNSQRNNMSGGGGPSSRSISNSGGGGGGGGNMMRGGNNANNMSRGSNSSGAAGGGGSGQRIGGAFNRNDNRSGGPSNGGGGGGGSGPQVRGGGNNNAQSCGGTSYGGGRR